MSDRSLALCGLLEGHADFVYRSLRFLGIAEARLDDALERVFLHAHGQLIARDGRLTRGSLYAACRRIARAGAVEVGAPRLPPGSRGRCDALALLDRVLSLLAPSQREVFLLYEVEDLPVAEIAVALDRSERSVRSLLREARARVVAEVERIAAHAQDE